MLGKILKDIFTQGRRATAPQSPAIIDLPEIRQAENGRILCFSAASEGNALEYFTRDLVSPFASKARGIHFININDSDWFTKLVDVLDEPIWFAMAFFGVGQDTAVLKNGQPVNIWEAHGIPFLRLYGDTPAYFPDRHVQLRRGLINGYFDQAHPLFLRRWFDSQTFSVLLPSTLLDSTPFENLDVDAKLRGKIIFPKNGNSPKQLIDYWRLVLPRAILKPVEELAEESISPEWIDREPCFDDRLLERFASFGFDLAAEPAVLLYLIAQLDDYVRRVKCTMIAEALLDLPVIIRGRFWGHVNFSGKRVTYDPNSDAASTQSLIDQAPAVVDMSPNKQHSAHDRIRRAAGRWTAFLTNKTAFLSEAIPNSERFTFSFEREAIRNLVEHYVDNPREAVEMGFEQARALREVYSEEAYVNAVSNAVAISAFSMRERPIGTQNFVDFPPKFFSRRFR